MKLNDLLKVFSPNTYIILNKGEPRKIKEWRKDPMWPFFEDRVIEKGTVEIFYDFNDMPKGTLWIKII